jgi:hypothetical protein
MARKNRKPTKLITLVEAVSYYRSNGGDIVIKRRKDGLIIIKLLADKQDFAIRKLIRRELKTWVTIEAAIIYACRHFGSFMESEITLSFKKSIAT